MHIAAVCVTYLRPKTLGHLVRAWLDQDFRQQSPELSAELLILDDAGQYADQRGDDWRLISIPHRFKTLGEKRNAAIALTHRDTDAFCVWDDDDFYLPHAVSACARCLQEHAWIRPSQVLQETAHGSGILQRRLTGGLYHGGWAFSREAFKRAAGYPCMNNGEDQEIAARLERAGFRSVDPIALGHDPYYVYRWGSAAGYHLSGMGPHGYRKLGDRTPPEKTTLDLNEYPPGLKTPTILDQVLPRPF